jgi:hypothetical protein
VAVVASYCLAGGLLTGKYSRPGTTGRHDPQRIEKLRQRGVLDQVDGWARLAAEHGATAAQLCLAFSLSRPSVTSACFGAKSTAQLAEDLGTLAVAGGLGPAISRLEADTARRSPPGPTRRFRPFFLRWPAGQLVSLRSSHWRDWISARTRTVRTMRTIAPPCCLAWHGSGWCSRLRPCGWSPMMRTNRPPQSAPAIGRARWAGGRGYERGRGPQGARASGIRVRIDGDDLVLGASSPPPSAVLALRAPQGGIARLLRPVNDGWPADG